MNGLYDSFHMELQFTVLPHLIVLTELFVVAARHVFLDSFVGVFFAWGVCAPIIQPSLPLCVPRTPVDLDILYVERLLALGTFECGASYVQPPTPPRVTDGQLVPFTLWIFALPISVGTNGYGIVFISSG